MKNLSLFMLFFYLSVIAAFVSRADPPPNPTKSDTANNTAGGTDVLLPNIGLLNTGFGNAALGSNTSGNDNTAIGAFALVDNTTGTLNTASGALALQHNTTGSDNTGSGFYALRNNVLGNLNSAVGSNALYSNTIGSGNSALGVKALYSNIDGSYNTASGYQALYNNTSAWYNTATGMNALFSNTTGGSNTATGTNALFTNSIGGNNTALGYQALFFNTVGGANTANGVNALIKNINGSKNTALGYQALSKNPAGNNNLALGTNAGINLISGNNNIYLANPGLATESNTIRIGIAGHVMTIIGGIRGRTVGANAVPVVIDSAGRLGTEVSSERFKKDIQDMADASQNLLKLRPVTYHYKQADENGDNRLEYGLIAEEVAKVYPDLVAYAADGKIETVQYQKLTPMLLNELQKQSRISQQQMNETVALKGQMKTLQENAEQRQMALAAKLKSEQLNNQALTQEVSELRRQLGGMQTEIRKVADLKREITSMAAQAKAMQTLIARLSRLEAQIMVSVNP